MMSFNWALAGMSSTSELRQRLALVERTLCHTPVVQLADDRLNLFAKLEYMNGVGSIKDRPALWILKRAIERGEVGPRTTVVESSSGNFARALATYARMLEIDFIPVIDPNVSPLYESSLRALCQRVVKVEELDDTGGFLKSRLDMVQTLLAEIPDSYWTNQYGNPDGMEAHYLLTGPEIIDDLPSLDYVFLGVSSGGTVAGVSRRLKEHDPDVKIIAVDAEGSVIFGQPAAKRWIPGLGSSIVPPLLAHALIDDVVFVSEPDAIAGCHEILERHGLFAGGSTGSAYSAVQQYFGEAATSARPRVLFLCCDRGAAYLSTIFDRRWAAWRLEVANADSKRDQAIL